MTLRAWSLLTGDGGALNLSALPVVCEHLGITDPGALLHQIEIIKRWRHERVQKKD